jgi:hypothetical protein
MLSDADCCTISHQPDYRVIHRLGILLQGFTRSSKMPASCMGCLVCAGAAAQFFCETPSKTGTSTDTGLASDTYDECVYREDTLVLLELTTRDMMEVHPLFLSSSPQY